METNETREVASFHTSHSHKKSLLAANVRECWKNQSIQSLAKSNRTEGSRSCCHGCHQSLVMPFLCDHDVGKPSWPVQHLCSHPNLPKWKALTSYVLVMVMLVVLSALKNKKNRINQENLSKGIPIEINYESYILKVVVFSFFPFWLVHFIPHSMLSVRKNS